MNHIETLLEQQPDRYESDMIDAGYVLSKEASLLFNKKDYNGALEAYDKAIEKFLIALKNTKGEESLAKSIKNNILSAHKNILACKFALGIGVSEAAKSAFDEERCEDAKRLYSKAVEHFVGSVQNAKEIGIIENTQVIFRDSVVQRSKIGKE